MFRNWALVFALGGFVAGAAYAQSPPPSGYDIHFLGLTGPLYEFIDSGGTHRSSSPVALNAVGQVAGISNLAPNYFGAQTHDAWFYDGTTTQLIGLSGEGYEFNTPEGLIRRGFVDRLNTTGQVLGHNERFTDWDVSLGQDVWLFNGTSTQRIGLIGAGYEYTDGSGTYRNTYSAAMNAAGNVVGSTNRFNASGAILGSDAWLYNGSTTQVIGLAGGVYEYTDANGTNHWGAAEGINDFGQMIGVAGRYSGPRAHPGDMDLGEDAWFFNGSTTQMISLTGPEYEYGAARTSDPFLINAAGKVAGVALRYSDLGTYYGADAWIYNGSTTQMIGLTGDGYDYGGGIDKARLNVPSHMNAAGQVVGTTERRGSMTAYRGTDVWLFDGSTTHLIGLQGLGEYEYFAGDDVNFRESYFHQMNDSGQAIGMSSRFVPFSFRGTDAWFYDGTSTRRVGLSGPGYEFAVSWPGGGIFRRSEAVQLNTAGQAIGFNTRFDSSGNELGQSGWIFDDDTGISVPLEFSFRPSDNYSFTSPQFLTDQGVVLGYFDLFSGNTLLGIHAFWWSDDAGMFDLGAMVNGGLSAAGWEQLSAEFQGVGTLPGGSPMFITGTGLFSGLASDSSDTFLLTPVPEPASLALAALAGLALRRRRRA